MGSSGAGEAALLGVRAPLFLKSPATAVLKASGRRYLRMAAFTTSGVSAEIFLSMSADQAKVRPRSR